MECSVEAGLAGSPLHGQADRIATLKKAAVATFWQPVMFRMRILSQPAKPARCWDFFDATDLHWVLGYWQQLCSTRTPGQCGISGACESLVRPPGQSEYPSGEGLYTIHERKRHQEVRAHLEVLLDLIRRLLIVVLDTASAYTTPKLEAFLTQQQDRLKLVFQPTYSPHLNLIERLCGDARPNDPKSILCKSQRTG